jgi:calcyclin binding protein
LIFAIKPTFGEIIPEQCKYLQKTNLFSITLTKKSSGTWTQLNFKEDKFKADKKEDNADPNASLMNMMKKMYEEGDDTMKKTIAEAWTKSKDKKGEEAFKLD